MGPERHRRRKSKASLEKICVFVGFFFPTQAEIWFRAQSYKQLYCYVDYSNLQWQQRASRYVRILPIPCYREACTLSHPKQDCRTLRFCLSAFSKGSCRIMKGKGYIFGNGEWLRLEKAACSCEHQPPCNMSEQKVMRP